MHDKDGPRDPGSLSVTSPVSRRVQRGFFYLALARETFYKAPMVSAARLLILGSVILTGCDTVKTAAVGTFRVVDAPAHYVREKIDSPPPTTTTTTEANGTSDVSTPGQPVNPPAKTSSSTETRGCDAKSRSRSDSRDFDLRDQDNGCLPQAVSFRHSADGNRKNSRVSDCAAGPWEAGVRL